MKPCPVDSCWVPETTCALGHLNPSTCPNLKRSEQEDNATTQSSDMLVLPWSGSAFGLVDVGFVAGRRAPTLVGVVGPENAGKTTLLSAWYLLVGRGIATTESHVFAGSFTLPGWEAVASSLRWAPGSPPEFPPHTSTSLGRGQGLLHIAFRENGDLVRDYLFTDAPGRWFQKWAINENAAEAAGARWIFEHADLFLLVADCAALSGEERGSARAALQLLARRVAATRRERPVLLVWSKSDVRISEDIEKAVREAVKSQIPDAEEFQTSVLLQGEAREGRGLGLTILMDRVLHLRRRKQILPPAQRDSSDPLFLFGAR